MKVNQRIQSGAVAAAVAIACGSGVVGDFSNAATFVAPAANATVTVSSQYVALAAASQTIGVTANVTMGVAYASGDRIRIGISGASFGTVMAGPAVANGCTVDALTYDGTVANYRIPAGGMVSTAVCAFPLAIKTSSITGPVSFTYQSFIAGTTESLETQVSSTERIKVVANQFTAAVARQFAGVVDVEKDRYHFAADDPTSGGLLDGFESQLHISINNSAPALSAGNAAAVSSVTVSIVGDFSWLDDDGSNSCAAGDVTGTGAGAGRAAANNGVSGSSGTFAFACPASGNSTLSYVMTNGPGGLSLTSGVLTIAVGKNFVNTTSPQTNSLGVVEKRITAPASYTASVTFSYFNPDRTGALATGSVSAVSGAAAGSFSLNGSTVNVPFMPYGTGISRVLYLTNRSAQTGSVSIALVGDGTTAACTGTTTTTAKGNGVTLLSTLLDETVTACYGADYSGKVAAVITSNTPAASTEVFSAYNRNGSLTVVVNSSNGK